MLLSDLAIDKNVVQVGLTEVVKKVSQNIIDVLLKDAHVRIMQSKSCRYSDKRTLIVRSYMSERAVYYIGVSRARPNQALARTTE